MSSLILLAVLVVWHLVNKLMVVIFPVLLSFYKHKVMYKYSQAHVLQSLTIKKRLLKWVKMSISSLKFPAQPLLAPQPPPLQKLS